MNPGTKQFALKETANTPRMIGHFVGDPAGPTLIAVGSIHGNEPSGRVALQRIAERLAPIETRLRGRVFLVTGNVQASALGVRYQEQDLNRHWTRDSIIRNTSGFDSNSPEDLEQHQLLTIFRDALKTAVDEVYVLDLHSTSAGGRPFATVGDTMRNRNFARALPVTILLGIEEQLEGTMLEFLNNEGAVTLGFEAGRHLDPAAIDNHEALVMLALRNTGILNDEDAQGLKVFRDRLRSASGPADIFEVRHREAVSGFDEFTMLPGFKNFDPVKAGQVLASNVNGPIKAPERGLIMMPLYQTLGEDGFFIVRPVAAFWLWLSALLRKMKAADLMHLLPGVRQYPKRPEQLQVDTRIARFFPLQLFHLLGFRKLRSKRHFLVVSRRRHDTSGPFTERRN